MKGFGLIERDAGITGAATGRISGSERTGVQSANKLAQGAGSVDTGREMKLAIQSATDESATRPTHPAATNPNTEKAPFRLPAGFTGMKTHPARNARAEHRLAQRQRVEASAPLAEKYPCLKSLKGNLDFIIREGMTKTTEIKYSANPEYAKSVLVFACPVSECVGGDFDLTTKLAQAVTKRQTKLAGQVHCMGSHKRPSGNVAPCQSLLCYTLSLAYSKGG